MHHARRRHDVVAVDGDVADSVPGGPALERCGVLRRRRRELGVAVVLTEEDRREVPHCCEVHRLMERTLRDGAVAEEGHGDAVVVS